MFPENVMLGVIASRFLIRQLRPIPVRRNILTGRKERERYGHINGFPLPMRNAITFWF